MRTFRRGQELVVLAPAKVNLFLEVLGKRPDGYHDIATLMVALRFHDVLRFAPDAGGEVTLECDRPDLSTGPDNLIVRAARLLQQRTGSTRGARIHLVKRIPLMGGLAGGSTDAVATFLALDRLWNLGRSTEELAEWSAEIGSDMPFFFRLPAAWCTGRGEQVRPVTVRKALNLVLVCPPFGCSTAGVYRAVVRSERPQSGDAILEALAKGDLPTLGRLLHNRLEPAALTLAPELDAIRQRLAAQRPLGQLMSGSGSTLFALFADREHARRCARELRRIPELKACRIFAVRSAVSPPAPGDAP